MRLRGLIVLMALCAALGAPNAAPAARTLFAPCGANGLQCATVNVPLDRSGATPGTVSLHVEELPAPGIPRGVLFLIAGGPGQASAGAFTLGANALDLRSEYPGYTLIAFDPRGTGRSGLLRCPELQADPFAALTRVQALVAKCGTEIGASRDFYSTRDHADDIDAVRRALGVDKIALEGTSYGTQLSVAYALTYPSHVERLILDSVADPAGRDPFALDDLQQMPKGLASLCSGGLCRAATSNFVGELVKLANRMAAHPVAGKVAKQSGGTRTVRATGFDFLGGAVLDSDLNAGLAAELPAAVHAALRGRTRPLLRLVQLDRQTAITSAEDLSMGLFTATVCDDGPFPWAPETPLGQRPGLLAGARSALPKGSTGPFGIWATDLGPAPFCLRWPPQARRPGIGSGPLPNVPVLVFAGERDLRTPATNAAAIAARFPQGRLVTVPGVGHSVLGTDFTGCAQTAVSIWLSGGVPPSRCPRSPMLVNPIGAFPASFATLKPGRTGGVRGRTLAAVAKTVREAAASWAFSLTGFTQVQAIAGLYGGTIRASGTSFVLKGYSTVAGVRISGSLRLYRPEARSPLPARFVGSVRVDGTKAAHGRLAVGASTLSGRLGGRRVHGPA
ncbi:MAG: alpha/beta hydrolase [Actinobacteria bacterium]|nr:MAG: alpha/beta hydrolase [Actinomycetota bacterium]